MSKFIRLCTLVPLALIFVFFACTDINTVKKEEAPKAKLSAQYISAVELLPEPDPEIHKEILNASKNKRAGRLYKQVMVHPKGEVPGSHGAPVVGNFADAIARVKPNGTIRVFPGEYEINQPVVIDRAVTIESKGKKSPVIRNTGIHAFLISGVEKGTVTFKGLSFENGGHSSIAVIGSEVLISGSRFDAGNGTAGSFAGQGAKLTIEKSHFTGGLAGTFASGEDAKLIIHSSSFSAHSLVGVQYQFGADGILNGSNLTDCGTGGCARAFLGSKVNMLDNRFSDDISDSEVIGFFHHIVLYSGATGRLSGNLFDGCGHGQCVGGINGTVMEISDNRFNIYESHNTRFVIVGSDGTGGEDPFGREVDLMVTDNVIVGIGGNSENNPRNPDAYAIKLGGILIENLGRMEAHRNTIKNANMGFVILSGGILTDGRDNRVEQVRTAVAAYDLEGLGESLATLRNNDFTDYAIAVLNHSFSNNTDLTCNWWGTAEGPQNSEGGQSSASLYTPWATAPVTGSSNASCTEGL